MVPFVRRGTEYVKGPQSGVTLLSSQMSGLQLNLSSVMGSVCSGSDTHCLNYRVVFNLESILSTFFSWGIQTLNLCLVTLGFR